MNGFYRLRAVMTSLSTECKNESSSSVTVKYCAFSTSRIAAFCWSSERSHSRPTTPNQVHHTSAEQLSRTCDWKDKSYKRWSENVLLICTIVILTFLSQLYDRREQTTSAWKNTELYEDRWSTSVLVWKRHATPLIRCAYWPVLSIRHVQVGTDGNSTRETGVGLHLGLIVTLFVKRRGRILSWPRTCNEASPWSPVCFSTEIPQFIFSEDFNRFADPLLMKKISPFDLEL